MPRYGLLAIASILSDRTDYDVTLLFEPYVGTIDAGRIAREEPRYVLINGLTTSAPDNEAFVSRLRELMRGEVTVIAGGEHATMFPEDAARYADYVVIYEGDETILRLLDALEKSDLPTRERALAEIPGLAFRDSSGAWRHNAAAQRVESIDYRYDFRLVEGAKDAAARFRLAQVPLLTSRGCRHYCSFCAWISLYGKVGYYLRPAGDVLHDIVHTMEYTGIRNFMVVDNLFGGDVDYAEDLLRRIAGTFEGRTERPTFTVLCRADQFAGGPNVFTDAFLRTMRKAGVTHVSLGLESINPKSLLQMRKSSDVAQYFGAAERIRRFGLHVAATFVTGFDGDRREDVLGIADFAERIGCFTIQIYARNIAPGTLDDVLSDYRIIPGCQDRFRNGHTVNIFPSLMLPSDLQKALFDAASAFYDGKDPQKRLVGRIYRQIWKGIRPHYEALKRIETDILLPERIYVQDGADGYRLRDKEIQALAEDPERHSRLEERIRGIFRSIARKTFADDPAESLGTANSGRGSACATHEVTSRS